MDLHISAIYIFCWLEYGRRRICIVCVFNVFCHNMYDIHWICVGKCILHTYSIKGNLFWIFDFFSFFAIAFVPIWIWQSGGRCTFGWMDILPPRMPESLCHPCITLMALVNLSCIILYSADLWAAKCFLWNVKNVLFFSSSLFSYRVRGQKFLWDTWDATSSI